MKRTLCTTLAVGLLLPVAAAAAGQLMAPAPVGPGLAREVAEISQRCPTFH